MDRHTLWYRQPADAWSKALPIGNGRIGAMVYGAIDIENIQLNEDTLWSGGKTDRINKDCLPNIKKIQKEILNGDIKQAEELTVAAMSGIPQGQRAYMPLGNIFFKYTYNPNRPAPTIPLWNQTVLNQTEVKNYQRWLQMDTGISGCKYSIGDTDYEREMFISYPAKILAIRIQAKGSSKLNFSCMLYRYMNLDQVWKQDAHTIAFGGATGSDGIEYAGMLQVGYTDGKDQIIGEHLFIKDATEVVLLFTAATSYETPCPKDVCVQTLRDAVKKTYNELKVEHINDFGQLYNRLSLKLCTNMNIDVPTDIRLMLVKKGKTDVGCIEQHFNFGRYLLIASSRPGTLPANLQGIWNDTYYLSLCDSKFTININTQMNYWAAEMGNLSECHKPLFDLLERIDQSGRETARCMYGCSGFVAHHNTDIFADTAPQDQCLTATYWLMGGAWLSLHLWYHYEYSKDIEFLKKYFYILQDAVKFFNDYLVKNEEGYYVVVPTLSPENSYIIENDEHTSYNDEKFSDEFLLFSEDFFKKSKSKVTGSLCAGCALDNQILTQLYEVYLESRNILNLKEDNEVARKAEEVLKHICPPRIGRYGQIMEWMKDYEEIEPGHRHVSQLYCVYPGEQVTYEKTPELMDAARQTLERRLKYGGGHTGWSRAWMINLWARFRDGEKACENYLELLKSSTFMNMMDKHPYIGPEAATFQIDGNLGAVSGLLQCFVQNYDNKIVLLPAVSDALAEGSLFGMRLKGNAEISISWRDKKVTECVIKAYEPFYATLYINGYMKNITINAGEQYEYITD